MTHFFVGLFVKEDLGASQPAKFMQQAIMQLFDSKTMIGAVHSLVGREPNHICSRILRSTAEGQERVKNEKGEETKLNPVELIEKMQEIQDDGAEEPDENGMIDFYSDEPIKAKKHKHEESEDEDDDQDQKDRDE